jgi:hypothetical protein
MNFILISQLCLKNFENLSFLSLKYQVCTRILYFTKNFQAKRMQIHQIIVQPFQYILDLMWNFD